MVEMFRNYPQPDDYKPDNYPKCWHFKQIEIMTGETAIHTFEVPFNVEDECQVCEVIYKLGLEPVIIKTSLYDLEIEVEQDGSSIVICRLKPEETLLFKDTVLDTHVQLKFYMEDGQVSYSDIYKVYVKDSLDSNHMPEPKPLQPDDIVADDSDEDEYTTGGYGYTED